MWTLNGPKCAKPFTMKLISALTQAIAHRPIFPKSQRTFPSAIASSPTASTEAPSVFQLFTVKYHSAAAAAPSASQPLFPIELKPLIRMMSTSRIQFTSDFFFRQVSTHTVVYLCGIYSGTDTNTISFIVIIIIISMTTATTTTTQFKNERASGECDIEKYVFGKRTHWISGENERMKGGASTACALCTSKGKSSCSIEKKVFLMFPWRAFCFSAPWINSPTHAIVEHLVRWCNFIAGHQSASISHGNNNFLFQKIGHDSQARAQSSSSSNVYPFSLELVTRLFPLSSHTYSCQQNNPHFHTRPKIHSHFVLTQTNAVIIMNDN